MTEADLRDLLSGSDNQETEENVYNYVGIFNFLLVFFSVFIFKIKNLVLQYIIITIFLSLTMSIKIGAFFSSVLFLFYNWKEFVMSDKKVKIFFFLSLILSLSFLAADFFVPCGKIMLVTSSFGSIIVVLLNLYIIFSSGNISLQDIKEKFFSKISKSSENMNSETDEKKGGSTNKKKEMDFNYRQ